MALTVAVLSNSEEFLRFLDNELLNITETHETYTLRTIKVEYNINSIDEAKKLFRNGNKIWVQGDNSLTDCLYVINSNVEKDLFSENKVTFEAEEVLVELNYAPPFLQTEVTATNGFTIKTQNSQDYVKVNYYSLNYWFGEFFQIGIVQDCLTVYASRIAPRGMMSKMELLRFIEEETSNVFRTRYEKDPITNTIHRYLDFLNPNNANKDWELFWNYDIPEADDGTGTPVDEEGDPIPTTELTPSEENDGVEDEQDIVVFEEYHEPTYYTPSSLTFRLLKSDGTVLGSWNGVDIGITSTKGNLIRMAYKADEGLVAQSKTKTFTTPDINDVLCIQKYTDFTDENNYPFTSIASDPNKVSATLDNHSVFQVVHNSKVISEQNISPMLGDVHSEVLDLGYNVENIQYDVNESDTFNAIMPIIETSDEYSKTDVDTIINDWIDLQINKGDIIPMIISRITSSTEQTTGVTNNYYSEPIHPNTDEENNKYDYWAAVAYRTAPFQKNSGEAYVYDNTITGIDYTSIKKRPDLNDIRADDIFYPKIGPVNVSDEDKYAIYNQVALKLKETKYPEVNVKLDIANYKNKKFNDYQLWDKVYIKLPGYEELVSARVSKINKNSNDMAENTVELSTYSINTIVPQTKTVLYGDNVNFDYPLGGVVLVTLKDANDTVLPQKLITILITAEDNSGSAVYNLVTNDQGQAIIPIILNPGEYTAQAYFGGDELYEPVNASYDISVGGTLPEPEETESEPEPVAVPVVQKHTTPKTTNKKTTNKKTNNKKKTTGRTAPINSGVSKTVKEKALKIVGKKMDLAAAKAIAKWMTKVKHVNEQNFNRSPEYVLKTMKGNCCSQTRLMLELMDAAGVTDKYKLYYIHVHGSGGGHVFARLVKKSNNHGTYVDPTRSNPWGHYLANSYWGKIGSRPGSKYPALPF